VTVYYNEHDLRAAAWLRELIADGLLPEGDVDERSIADVQADELRRYVQCHFFAGIGGWPLALQRAGWPADRPVWTGSCPCQPFSSAGRRGGVDDERHLWPVWFRLIAQCRPVVCFGEQVGGDSGMRWLDALCDDLEGHGYACGAVSSPASGYGAPHARERLYWVAHTDSQGRGQQREGGPGTGVAPRDHADRRSEDGGVVHASSSGCGDDRRAVEGSALLQDAGGSGQAHWWSDAEWVECSDGARRPTQPGVRPLADGVLGRVALLRGAGNAIVVPQAEAFIRAYSYLAEDFIDD